MMTKKTKTLIASLLIGICTFFGMAKWHKPYTEPVPQKQLELPQSEIDYSNLIIQGIEKLNKLEVLQLNMNCDLTIHGSKFNNNFFRNDKIVKLNTTGRYKIDFDDITKDVIINGDNIIILVHIDTEVFVNEDKIEYQENKGYLMFNDVEVTPEAYNQMVIEAENLVLKEMKSDENMNEAKKRVEEKLKDIVNTIGGKPYNINIKFY